MRTDARLPTTFSACLLAAALLLAPATGRADGGWTLAAKAGVASSDLGLADGDGLALDDEATSWGLGVGFRFNRFLAVEGWYRQLGEHDGRGTPGATEGEPPEVLAPARADVESLEARAVGRLPIGPIFAVYGFVGVARVERDGVATGGPDPGAPISTPSDEESLVGGGFEIGLPGPLRAFVEYESIDAGFDSVEAGLALRF